MSANGERLLSSGYDGTIRVWDLQTGKCEHVLQTQHQVWTVSVSEDGRRALSGGMDQYVRVWDLQSGRCVMAIPADADVYAVAWLVDKDSEMHIVYGTDRGTVAVGRLVNIPTIES